MDDGQSSRHVREVVAVDCKHNSWPDTSLVFNARTRLIAFACVMDSQGDKERASKTSNSSVSAQKMIYQEESRFHLRTSYSLCPQHFSTPHAAQSVCLHPSLCQSSLSEPCTRRAGRVMPNAGI